jgi:hypothetical protein
MQRFAFLSFVVLLAPVSLAAQQTTPPAPAAPAAPAAVPHDSVRGAVRLVDLRSRTLEVITGVGFALRVVRLAVPVGVPVKDRAEAAAIALAELKPGDIVRVLFGGRGGPTRYVAYTIERVGRMETGPDARP